MRFIIIDYARIFFFCFSDILSHFACEFLVIILIIRQFKQIFYLLSKFFVFYFFVFRKNYFWCTSKESCRSRRSFFCKQTRKNPRQESIKKSKMLFLCWSLKERISSVSYIGGVVSIVYHILDYFNH